MRVADSQIGEISIPISIRNNVHQQIDVTSVICLASDHGAEVTDVALYHGIRDAQDLLSPRPPTIES
jgi:hypothetical protein